MRQQTEKRAIGKGSKILFLFLFGLIYLLIIFGVIPEQPVYGIVAMVPITCFVVFVIFDGFEGKGGKVERFKQKSVRKTFLFLKKLGLMPQPTEAGMFVMATTLIFLVLTTPDMWREMLNVMSEEGRSLLIFVYIIVGVFLSIFHAFSKKERTKFETGALKYFVAVTLAAASVSTAIYTFNTKESGYMLFAIWNGTQALLLLFFSGNEHVGEFIDLPTRQARLVEIFLALLVVIAILILNKFIFQQHWAIVFSIVLMVWGIVGFAYEKSVLDKIPRVGLNQ